MNILLNLLNKQVDEHQESDAEMTATQRAKESENKNIRNCTLNDCSRYVIRSRGPGRAMDWIAVFYSSVGVSFST